MLPLRTILHPTDFSEPAEAAFSVASMLARAHGARIVVLHATPPPINQEEADVRAMDSQYETKLWRALDRFHAIDPETKVDRRLTRGPAPEEILRIAKEENCDVIVMGTHGKTGLKQVLMGSVAEEVQRRAAIPVLTVFTPEPAVKPRKIVEEQVARR